MNREEVEQMINTLIDQKIVYSDANSIEIENTMCGENITFVFNSLGELENIYS